MSGLLADAALVCVAGGVGAAARLVLDGVLRQRLSPGYPLPTIMINWSGSLLLGLLTGLTLGRLLDPRWQLVLGTGLIWGYTTFSTASFEVARLVEERRWVAGTTHALSTVVVATALARGGLALGTALAPDRPGCLAPATRPVRATLNSDPTTPAPATRPANDRRTNPRTGPPP